MGNEDAVYLAKLAEQAERYEGKQSRLAFQSRHTIRAIKSLGR